MSSFERFKNNPERSLGAEQEFHLIDPDSGHLVSRFDEVRAALPADVRARCSAELKPCLLELQTPVCASAAELAAHAQADRLALAAACNAAGCRFAAAGSHPYAEWKQHAFVASEHYRWVEQETGYVADRMMAFGLHIHVGMDTPRAALYAIHEFRRWVYPLAALFANSPYFEGRDTRLNSVRLHLFGAMPRTGLPPDVETMDELQAVYDTLRAAGDVTVPGDLWWLLRPQPPLGTVEVRAFDLPTETRLVGVAGALCQAAMTTFRDDFLAGRDKTPLNETWLLENQWKAIRHGLDAKVIDAGTGDVIEMREHLARFFDRVEGAMLRLGSREFLDHARAILVDGNGATFQRQCAARFNHDLRALELDIAARSNADATVRLF